MNTDPVFETLCVFLEYQTMDKVQKLSSPSGLFSWDFPKLHLNHLFSINLDIFLFFQEEVEKFDPNDIYWTGKKVVYDP
jgi:hypothetical protein